MGLEGLWRLCVCHRCDRQLEWAACGPPTGHGSCPAWLKGWHCASDSRLSHAEQNSCLLSPRTCLAVGRHCTPGEPSAAGPCLGHSGNWRVVALPPWGTVSSVQAINTNISDAQRQARPVTPLKGLKPSVVCPVLSISSSTQGVEVGRDPSQCVPCAVCVCGHSLVLRGKHGLWALPLGSGIHTVRKKSKHLDLFSGKLPCSEVWYFNGVSALIWREVIFLSALLIRWELLYN